MEKNSLSNNLKLHGNIGGRISMKEDHKNSFKDSWEYCGSDSHGEDYLSGFSWPPRSYTCSFCKREFRSAQALGGHMNVHRRERARLRHSSPPMEAQFPFLNLNLKPDPNPNPNPCHNPNPNKSPYNPSSSLSTKFPLLTSTLPPLLSSPLSTLSSPSPVPPTEMTKWGTAMAAPFHRLSKRRADSTTTEPLKTRFLVGGFNGFMEESECGVLKEAEIVRLEMEIGSAHASVEDLDLELRLGCS
ncbi:hypothetical protein U1Q18_042208 [Sarracenia purpurea var. burkii]